MEQNSHIEILENQIREIYGRVIYTHKTHEKCADICNFWQSCVKFLQIILSVLTSAFAGSGVISNVLGKNNNFIIILSAITALMSLGLSLYVKNYDIGGLAQKHANTALELWNIREKYLSLLVDIRLNNKTIDKLIICRENLQTELNNIYKKAPRSTNKGYQKASKALKEMEEMTFSEDEINKFLPISLRK